MLALKALETLAAIGAEPSRKAVEAVVRDAASPRVAALAGTILATIDAAEGLDALLALSEKASWEARAEAVAALGELPRSDAAFSRVLRLLDDPNREVRSAAYASLRRFRRKDAVAAALKRLEPLQGRDRAQALSYLEWATGKKLGRDAAAWSRWWAAEESRFRFPGEGAGK